MVPRIDRRGPEQRHHHRLHDKFEGDAKRYADREDTGPTAWGRETERSPGGVRKPRPNEDEDSAQGHDKEVASQDNEQREEADRAKAAQLLGDPPRGGP